MKTFQIFSLCLLSYNFNSICMQKDCLDQIRNDDKQQRIAQQVVQRIREQWVTQQVQMQEALIKQKKEQQRQYWFIVQNKPDY